MRHSAGGPGPVARDEGVRFERPGSLSLIIPSALYGSVAAAIVVTYARIPAAELYHTSGAGLTAGLGRGLVFVNYSMALMGIGVAAVAADRLLVHGADRRWVAPAAVVAVALCAVAAWPGVVDQDDLDAKSINVLPAVGVAIAAVLTVAVLARRAPTVATSLPPAERRIRLALVAALGLLAIPWIAAELGFYVDGLPLVGDRLMASRLLPEGDGSRLAAVHLGHHHGLDGVLLALTALSLWPAARAMRTGTLQRLTVLYLAAMFTYGVANALQDAWFEQVVKRGSTAWEIPGVLRPERSTAWLGIVLGSVGLWLLLAGRVRATAARSR